ncbi:hypothetical protein [Bradyrhizobium yuanmingense]|uniref:hypothetical protein n=1 Tax=Bradyrhizobium yuanmingense TaxID=108015 RepID=UPI0009E97F01|nr:hypothetical protein [Bradyrhizobium yuanmingense]
MTVLDCTPEVGHDNCGAGHFEDDLWQRKERTRQFPTAYKIKAMKRVERGDGVLPVARKLEFLEKNSPANYRDSAI